MRSPILSAGVRIAAPLFVLVSLWILFRGHNAPGGGFIGGLIAACGFALVAFAEGTRRARAMLRLDPTTIGVLGLVAALLSGLMAAPLGAAPFAGIWADLFGLALSSVMLFDTGVYLAVVGGVLTLIFALEEMN